MPTTENSSLKRPTGTHLSEELPSEPRRSLSREKRLLFQPRRKTNKPFRKCWRLCRVKSTTRKIKWRIKIEDTHDGLSTTQRSLVHFLSRSTDSDTPALSLSQSLSDETSVSYYPSSPQVSGVTISTAGSKSPKSSLVSHPQSKNNLGVNKLKFPRKKSLPVHASEPAVVGQGEDYFLSLFGDSKKLTSHSFHTKKTWKHFSMILEEVGQSRSSALGDIKIAEVNVKGLFVKLINSSFDKELQIGNHTLQQNVNGQVVSLYRFLPNIIMQANSTVTVWSAASEAEHQPPSDFLWKEQNRFRTSPDCTTILCKPNGEAVAWYTPIHWKQAWEKLETDIEFDRSSIVSSTSRRHMFHWPAAPTTIEKQDQSKTGSSKCQVEHVQAFLKREKEIPPTLFPNRSPWCHSPNVPAHPYCPLIDPHDTGMAGRSLDTQPRSQSAGPSPAQRPRKNKTSELQK
ncbi:lamin tail domain-containing protein 1 isoform X1 [Camelus dromedarius]|uniref:lamin tail domain-containing protein 1 isoform X1 n=1 Tax=Camelus dromedarius TaxID=9838 RepID=UPI0012631E59|nr:lamin tail domain-containing protein 1 isoform X1 [Camelus dromedarius]XP_031299775.1 lamin tail domain-containing protein 1 isoform X1 [Camelus dromedarius]XP_031299776.1 lamin tail domain-containing protein 1 isoform X1 [Camelus dromedarius]XP_031299777.1 lamin tail domain-containing protein 1 isoform X1 [Camelus dromedarius]XP_031299778.1 lamin tail domain-containing protein 1 isoform X1 [Camelus dromedarius]XP_031299779.1 lamin tail domain-containing protein 1 isoform X1 [Camelus dromed